VNTVGGAFNSVAHDDPRRSKFDGFRALAHVTMPVVLALAVTSA
jgi:hypothetical protein